MSSVNECLRSTGQTCRDSEMSAASDESNSQMSISSAEDFPARTSAMQESEQVSTVNKADSGENSPESLAFYDHQSCCWKTSQRSLFGGLIEFSGTWPRSGTMRNGRVFARPTLERITCETAGGVLLPTPKASDPTRGANCNHSPMLHEVVRLLPTPTANDWKGGNHSGSGSASANSIATYAESLMLPTPRATDGEKGARKIHDRKEGPTLLEAVHLLPTPSARDWKSGRASKETLQKNSRPLSEAIEAKAGSGRLNPVWVEVLMGFPISWLDTSEEE